MQEMHF
ncbi:hypothetical protein F383_27997 [Gossypium arboreum]|nr:hypothetical protein F383_27997 [Gossypium arboreum]